MYNTFVYNMQLGYTYAWTPYHYNTQEFSCWHHLWFKLCKRHRRNF